MKSPTEEISFLKPCHSLGFSPSTGRLYPVLTGSIKTRSVCSSNVYSLSVSLKGGGGRLPSSCRTTRRGPSSPRCSHTEEEPGPPLKEKVMGRFPFSSTSSLV